MVSLTDKAVQCSGQFVDLLLISCVDIELRFIGFIVIHRSYSFGMGGALTVAVAVIFPLIC